MLVSATGVSSGRRMMMPSSTLHGGFYHVALRLSACPSAANRTRFPCKRIRSASRRLIHFISEDVQSKILGVCLPPVCTSAPAKFHCSRTVVRLFEHISTISTRLPSSQFFLGQVLFNVKVAFSLENHQSW